MVVACIVSYVLGVGCELYVFLFFFFFNDTATTEIYTLSLHDALPISQGKPEEFARRCGDDHGHVLAFSHRQTVLARIKKGIGRAHV